MKIIRRIFNLGLKRLLRNEYKSQRFVRFTERPAEFAFLFKTILSIYPKTVLDVGTGKTALPHLVRNCGMTVTAIDNLKDYYESTFINRHFHVIDDDILNPQKIDTKYDMVMCISVLEHIRDYAKAVKNLSNLVVEGGHIILTFPSSPAGYVENCYDLEGSAYGQGAKFTTQSFSPDMIDSWCSEFDLEELESEYWQYWTGQYWTQGEQVIPPVKTDSAGSYQLRCILLRKRSA